ncbi:MAG: hypothetical protein C4576_03815 [Desulfobacteraceae bacterium]|nr:MAG: hypothetical protein C4576_03815 [Desulfobacteraceae bacterium]
MRKGEKVTEKNCIAGRLGRDPELCRFCREAIAKLDDAVDLHPQELTKEVDIAENAVVKLRDRLIDEYRLGVPVADAAEFRQFLDQVNTAISLIAGVVYPSGGIQRSIVEEARKLLKDSTGPCRETADHEGRNSL